MTISDSNKCFDSRVINLVSVLSDITNVFCACELLIGFQFWITRLGTPPCMNSDGHDHGPRDICFSLAICKDA